MGGVELIKVGKELEQVEERVELLHTLREEYWHYLPRQTPCTHIREAHIHCNHTIGQAGKLLFPEA